MTIGSSSSSGVIEAEEVASSVGEGFGETKITLTPEFSGIGETIVLPLKTKTGRPIKNPTNKVPIAIVISCFFSINQALLYHKHSTIIYFPDNIPKQIHNNFGLIFDKQKLFLLFRDYTIQDHRRPDNTNILHNI